MGAFFMSVVSAFAGAAEACRPTGALQNVEVARVVDGDTVRLRDGRSVRLIGINAPELAHNGRTTEPFAEAAKQRLQALVSASDGRLALQPGRQARDPTGGPWRTCSMPAAPTSRRACSARAWATWWRSRRTPS